MSAITLMQSLTFFWKNIEMLEGLVETIGQCLSKRGYLLFFTLNGDSLMELLHPTMAPRSLWKDDYRFRCGPPGGTNGDVTMELTGNPREVRTCLPDIIVGTQTEYLPHLDDLFTRLLAKGIYFVEYATADSEKLLPDDQHLLSSLYSYGVLR